MKKHILLLSFMLAIVLGIKAQAPSVSGIWEAPNGSRFKFVGNNSGFSSKNLSDNSTNQVNFVGYNYGYPWFRADFDDGFVLYMLKSENEMNVSSSQNPNKMVTLVKQGGGYSNNNQMQNSGTMQYQPTMKQPKTCSVCNGTGYSNSVIWAPNYGTPPDDEWCSICKSYKKPHTHRPCSSCGGLGEK
ncbi:MAG: hypothetical protein ACOYN4_18185 [Bacteroidales bacterium]